MSNRRVNLAENTAVDLSAAAGSAGTGRYLIQNRGASAVMLGWLRGMPTPSEIASLGYVIQPGEFITLHGGNPNELLWGIAPSDVGRLSVGDGLPS